MTKRLLYIVLIILLVADLSFSFMQHYSQTLDGDMAWNIIPSSEVKPIFESPLGFKAISEKITYANPNRFFCHWSFREYLLSMPLLLQKIVDPIDSVYMACAISKIFIQALLIFLLAMAITGSMNILKLDFMIASVLITPLFQVNGYQNYMGIIDPSTTYTFFYALPLAILLIYLMPFILQFYFNKKHKRQFIIRILWIPLAFIVCLSGPLNPGVILIFSSLMIIPQLVKNFVHSNLKGFLPRVSLAFSKIPPNYWVFLAPVSILSLYSLILGRYNSITISTQIPLIEMYARIPEGIYYQFTQKPGFPVLFSIITLNAFIIWKYFKDDEGKMIISLYKWIGYFSFLYILLLPLGGYREYRPNVLRFDTIMPVTLALIFIFGITTLFLIRNLPVKYKFWYFPVITAVLFVFTFADEPKFDKNQCERSALNEIALSQVDVIQVEHDCCVATWNKIDNPELSELNAQLFTLWRITNENKYYYNK